MSFGRAASPAAGRPASGTACPCGSGAAFGACCSPIVDGGPAATPEALMRSRYTAFVVRDAMHLRRSWHPSTRPAEIDLDAETAWTGLTVVRAEGGAGDATGTVEFRALWRTPTERGELHEVSRFVRVRERWVYVNGVIEA